NGVTLNDPQDADTGPNGYQNFPVLSRAQSGATTRVVGTLNSTPGTTFTLDFYASAARDPSGYGEGQRYLGSTTVTTDGLGNAAFDLTLAATTASGEWVTATATDPAGSTSEFSLALQASPDNAPIGVSLSPNTVAENSPVGTVVGTFATTDQDAGDTFTYTLVTGSGDTDNASFQAVGNQLRTNAVFDFETRSSYSIRVRTTDQDGL